MQPLAFSQNVNNQMYTVCLVQSELGKLSHLHILIRVTNETVPDQDSSAVVRLGSSIYSHSTGIM